MEINYVNCLKERMGDDMYKIGEFSNLCQVSTRMLRHYEKLGLLQPDAVDRQTGYRSYTKRQLEQVHRIVALKELDMSLKEIRQLSAET